MKPIPYAALLDVVSRLFEQVGLAPEPAREVARAFVVAEAKGVVSHGVDLVPKHLEQMAKGNMNLRPEVRIVRETAATAVLDGDAGPGPVVLNRALDIGMDKARRTGMAGLWITNLQHYAAGLTYAVRPTAAGMIFTMCANAPASMVPFGGRKRLFGTNPLTFAAPAGKHPPYVLDMATSVVAGNKIEQFIRAGQPLPPGYGLNGDGDPSSDPAEVLKNGALLPFGGAKGSGLAGMLDLLAGVLSGGGYADDVVSLCRDPAKPANYGCHLSLVSIDAVMEAATYAARMEDWVERILRVPPAAGFERVTYPGYTEGMRFEKAQQEGVPVADSGYRHLVEAGKIVGVDVEQELH